MTVWSFLVAAVVLVCLLITVTVWQSVLQLVAPDLRLERCSRAGPDGIGLPAWQEVAASRGAVPRAHPRHRRFRAAFRADQVRLSRSRKTPATPSSTSAVPVRVQPVSLSSSTSHPRKAATTGFT